MSNRLESNPYQYPKGYFGVQVAYASKWSEIARIPWQKAVAEKTAIQRKLFGGTWQGPESPRWTSFLPKLAQLVVDRERTDLIWETYTKQPRSTYAPDVYTDGNGEQFGSFAYDHQPDKNRIKVHFYGQKRGEKSDLARDFLSERICDLTKMFTSIKTRFPLASSVIGGSWLYNLEAYRRCWPPEFTHNAPPVPRANLSFRGDSIWGQFIKADGYEAVDRVTRFRQNLTAAKNEDDLYQSFPFLPLLPQARISVFYDFYKVK